MSLDLELYVEVDLGSPSGLDTRVYIEGTKVNATHNLVPMWQEAGIYEALYREHDQFAGDRLDLLKEGYADMIARPEIYKGLEPKNGWGTYTWAVDFLDHWIKACEEYPSARIEVSS